VGWVLRCSRGITSSCGVVFKVGVRAINAASTDFYFTP
jgi:hypothetical protein